MIDMNIYKEVLSLQKNSKSETLPSIIQIIEFYYIKQYLIFLLFITI